ncbi:MAG TPA: hypothetical protein PKN48_13770 [Bacteroidales bacterium]|nr:hypothetical protein [Bacteroidales bacterium]
METPQENNPQKEKKSGHPKLWRIIGFLVLFAIIGLLIYSNINSQRNHERAMAEIQLQYEHELNSLAKSRKTVDSLRKIATHLNKYFALVEAAYTRDSSRIAIPHVIGDIVKLKIDGSNVVITDIVVGGGMFEYYLRYRVMHSDRQTEEISPEMIF